jgi:hypothetical protein
VDTVGAWVIYRAVRDRGAKVIGAKDVSRHCSNAVARI